MAAHCGSCVVPPLCLPRPCCRPLQAIGCRRKSVMFCRGATLRRLASLSSTCCCCFFSALPALFLNESLANKWAPEKLFSWTGRRNVKGLYATKPFICSEYTESKYWGAMSLLFRFLMTVLHENARDFPSITVQQRRLLFVYPLCACLCC